MHGYALDTYKAAIQENADVNYILDQLIVKHTRSPSQYLSEFNECQPTHHETPLNFAYRLKKLLDNALPTTYTKSKDTLLKEKFIKCLPKEVEKIVQFNSAKFSIKEILDAIDPVLSKFDTIKPLEEIDLNYISSNQVNKQFNHQFQTTNKQLFNSKNNFQQKNHRKSGHQSKNFSKNNHNPENNSYSSSDRKNQLKNEQQSMHCDYCQRNNHNTDECRLKLKHDKECNAALHKSTAQLGQHSKRFISTFQATIQ